MMNFMRLFLIPALIGNLLADESKTISLKDLQTKQVIGDLGLPLGTATRVNATIVDGSTLGLKRLQSTYLLKISKIGDKPLASPVLMEFRSHRSSEPLPGNFLELKKSKISQRKGSSKNLEKGYIGKEVHLLVYETGSYSGIPNELPDNFELWQDTGFEFRTSLSILKILDNSKK